MIRILFTVFLCVLLSACNKPKGTSDLESFTKNAFKNHVPEVEPLPPLRPTAVFIYTASDQVDPFNTRNLRIQDTASEDPGGGEQGPDLTRRKEPLEAYPIDALKLVGVMTQNGIDWAIVSAPDQTVHRVTEGNYMGTNYGEITRIKGNKLTVTELIRNPVGRWEKKPIKIILLE
jgi:type IV pilus assembly protein PilP